MVRVRVVEGVEVPASVDGQAADRVGALGDQAPQVVGRADAAGVAAAHADDDDRVVGGGGRPRGGGGGLGLGGVGQFGQEVAGQGRDGRVVEDDGGGGAQAGGGGQPVPQLDSGQGVEPELLEGAFGVDVGGGGVAEDGGRPVAHQVDDGLRAGLFVQPGEPLGEAEGGLGTGAHRAAGTGADQAAQERGHLAPATQGGQVEADGQDGGAGQGEGGVEEGQALFDGERRRSGAGHALQVPLGEFAGHAAVDGHPGAPAEGEAGQPGVATQAGDGVQEGVTGRVVGLARGAGGAGEGGEHHEGGEVEVAGGPVQMPDGVGLGPQDGGEPLLGEGFDQSVVEGAGGVHDGGDGVGGRYGGEQPVHGFRVGDVAGGESDLGAQRAEVGGESGGAGGVGAAPAGEHQVAYAALGDEVAGEGGAEAAGAAGDDNGPLGVPGGGGGLAVGADAGEPGGEHGVAPQRGLRFLGGEGRDEPGGVGPGDGVEVEQAEAVGVFGLGGADQAPDGGGGRVGERPFADGDGAPGDEHQARPGPGVLGEPTLDVPEDAGGARVDLGGYGLGVAAADGDEHQGRRVGSGGLGERADGDPGGGEGGAEPEGVGAEQTDGAGGFGGVGAVEAGPVEVEEGVALQHAGGGPARVGGGAQHEGADRGDGCPGGVRDGEGDGVVARGGDADAGLGGAGRVEGDVLPGERQAAAGVLAERGEGGGVQGRVQQRRVQAERRGVARGSRVESHLGEGLLAPAPDGAQAAEGGAVGEAGLGQPLVEAVEADTLGAGGRPDRRVELLAVVGAGGQGAGGVLGPGPVVVAVGAGVQGQGAAAGLVGAADPDLDLDAAVLGQGERGGEGEFLDAVAADLVAGADGEFEEGGAGQQHGAAHRVVGEPGMGAHREAAGEEQAVGVGEGDGGGEQRVVGGAEPRGAHVAGEPRDALGPEAAVLEGVGRQVGVAGAGPLEPAVPAHRDAAQVESGGGLGEGGGLGAVLAERGQHGGALVPGGVQDGPGEGGEGGVGAQFEEEPGAVAGEPGDSVGEAHGVADVIGPVAGGGELLDGGGGAGEVGDDRDGGGLRGESGDDRAELLQHRVHERRVERVGDPQPAGAAPEGRDAGGDGLDGVLGSGDDDRGRAVDGGDGDLSGVFGDERRDLVLGGLQGDHGAALVQRLHEAATGGDQGAGVGEGEHPGDVGGGYLADGVSGEVVGGDAPGLDEPVQGHFEGEQGGLRVLGAVEERGLLAALLGEDQGLQRAVEPRVEVLQDLVEGAGEDGEAGVKVAAHAGTLGALAREEHGELGTATQLVGGETRGVRTGGERGEDGDGGVPVGGGEGRAVLQGGAGGGERVGDVQGRRRRPGGEVVEEPGGLGAQGLGGTAGEQPGQRPGVDGRGGLVVGGRLLGSLLDDGVRVGAGEAEGGDARATRCVLAGRPGGGLRQQADGALAPVDVGGGLVDVEGARQQAVAHRHDHLDDARDTRRGLGVADVGLDRAEQQGAAGLAALAVGGQQRLGLDGVAEDRAGAVRLDGVDVGGGEPGVDQGGLDDALLGGAVGGGQAVGGTVLVDGGPPDHGEDAVTPAARAREHSPARSDWAARCRATREEEQAVSTVTAGPTAPKK